jgi:hypothetical protein
VRRIGERYRRPGIAISVLDVNAQKGRRPWRSAPAAAIGVCCALWGWLDYGAFEMGHFSNYILGCLFLGGFAFLAAAALRNWVRRNPL